MISVRLISALVLGALVSYCAQGVQPSAGDTSQFHEWVAGHLKTGAPVFSFTLDGKPSTEAAWTETFTSRKLDADRTEFTRTRTDAKSNLAVRCVAIEYADFPAVEWTVFFKNNGDKDTPIIENIQAINASFGSKPAPGKFKLFYSLGSHEKPNDFAPTLKTLDAPAHLAPYGGRSSDGVLPFFNISKPDGTGVIMGIGWTGQWAADFSKTDATTMNVQAGMERTHLRLHPGEEIRTPAILLLFWSGGDSLEGNNLLRRLLLKHYTPMPNGKPVKPPIAASPHAAIAFSNSTEANMIQGIRNVADHQFPVDTWWIDAGWNGEQKEWARAVGTWEPNIERYPRGMKPVADAAHAHGFRFLLWFEPERVMPDTWLFKNHPEWLLSPADLPPELRYQDKDKFRLLDLGNPDALAWAKTTLSRMIGDVGIDIYRQDFNMTPLYFWRNGEAPDRQGMREIKHVMGLYDLYDTLRRDHPGLLIDNCASGGRRIDFEIMRRALSLFRSDLCWDPTAEQSMTYGISYWLPITGVGAVSIAPYDFRSGMGAHMSLALDYYNKLDMWKPASAMIRQYQQIRHLFTEDFYPLTDYTLDKDKWIAWQYHAPETGEGIVQAFRRDACAADAIHLKLRALNPDITYTITDFDTSSTSELTGKQLMEQGLNVHKATAPGAALFHYTVREPAMEDVRFTAACDGSEQRYVRILPEPFITAKPHDVLIALHGHGADRWQFAKDPRDECRAARDAAARHGMIFVSPDYRAATSWMGPKAEADVVRIIKDLKRQNRVGKVYLCGASMGGAACLTFAVRHPELLSGVASMNGTANHVEYNGFQDAIRESFGGTKSEVPDEYRNRSAEFFPEKLTMPVGITAGGKDELVPSQSVLRLADSLKKLGRKVLVIYRKDGGHATNYEDATAILDFITKRRK